MIIKFVKINERAIVPTKGTKFSAGVDLYSAEDRDVTIMPNTTEFVGTGLKMEIPTGYVGLIYARSGLACKRGIAPANKVGVIDSDYRGEIMIALHNHSTVPQVVCKGERVAQMIITSYMNVDFEECQNLDDTDRGEGGFGSTGIK